MFMSRKELTSFRDQAWEPAKSQHRASESFINWGRHSPKIRGVEWDRKQKHWVRSRYTSASLIRHVQSDYDLPSQQQRTEGKIEPRDSEMPRIVEEGQRKGGRESFKEDVTTEEKHSDASLLALKMDKRCHEPKDVDGL